MVVYVLMDEKMTTINRNYMDLWCTNQLLYCRFKKGGLLNSYVWGKLRTQWIGETHSIETPSIFLVGFLRVMCPFRRLAAAVFFNRCDFNTQPRKETFGSSTSTRTLTRWAGRKIHALEPARYWSRVQGRHWSREGIGKGTNHHDSQPNLDEHWCRHCRFIGT